MAVLDQVKSVLPDISLSTVGNFAYYAVLTVLAVIIVGGFFGLWAWWYISRKRFSKTIRIFEKVDGRYRPTMTDKAMERKIGTGGDTVFYFKKLKKIVPTPSIQTGTNTYWFARRADGEYVNIGLEDIDLKMREAKINYLDKETRYARASLQKLNKDRFDQQTFWQKYGRDVLTIVFIVIVSVMLLLILSKMVALMGSIQGGIDNYGVVTEKISNLIGALDNICSPSGVRPA